MKTMLTLALILAGGAFASAQEDRDRRLDEMRRDHDRRLQELQRKFDDDRSRLESDFRRRVEESRRPEATPDRRGGGGVEEQIRRLSEQVERLTREVEQLKRGGRPGPERLPEARREGERPQQEFRRPEAPRPPEPRFERPGEPRRPEAPRPPEPPRVERPAEPRRPEPPRERREKDQENPPPKRPDRDGTF